MNKKITKFMAALALLVFMTPSLAGWGQTDYSTTYTSNITLSDANGSNASTAKVRLSSNGTQYDAIKLGTGSATGYAYITVPANTTTLHIHCAGWNGDGNSRTLNLTTDASGVTITPVNMSLTNDAGVKSSSPFTLDTPSNASTAYYKSFTLAGVTQATTIKLATSAKRAVYWGVNVEAVTPPSCTVDPSSWNFGSLQVNSTAQTKTFVVTTSNLQHGLSVSLTDYVNYSTTVYGISSSATTTNIPVTFSPNTVGTHTAKLVLSGQDFANDIEVDLFATVISSDPTCTIDPTIWEFGNVAFGTSATKEFMVTTANLTGDLTLAMSEDVYSFSPATIAQNATTTTVTVTFTPTAAEEVYDELSITGGGLTAATTAIVSGTGYEAPTYTVTFDAGSGTCGTPSVTNIAGYQFELPAASPSGICGEAGWEFVGWSTTSIDETTTAPATAAAGTIYTMTAANITLYAVYKQTENIDTNTEFVIARIAKANNWTDASTQNSITINPITITASKKDAKFYTSDSTWRCYNGGSVSIEATSNNITNVTSNTNTEFTIANGKASASFSATTKFSTISVTTSTQSVNYATSPSCALQVATPVFDPESGTVVAGTLVTISCDTEGATIHYSLDNGVTYSTYTAPIAITRVTTIKAYATKDEYTDSEITSAEYAIPAVCTVSFNINGSVAMTADVPQGTKLDLINFKAPVTSNIYEFAEWSESASDILLISTFTPAINQTEATLYAVYSEGTTSYQLVTDVASLEVGDNVVIAAANADKAVSTNQQTNNRKATNIIKNTSDNTISWSTNVCEFKLLNGAVENSWAFYDRDLAGYLYAGGTSNPYLKTQAALQPKASWTITITNDIMSIVGNDANVTYNRMRYVSGSDVFECYNDDNSGTAVSLYRKIATYVTTIGELVAEPSIVNIPNNVVVKVKNGSTLTLTGSNNGNTANLVIEDGGQLIHGSEGVKATVKKLVKSFDDTEEGGWKFIASPIMETVAATAVTNMIDETPANYSLFYYDEPNHMWYNFKQNEAGTNLHPGFSIAPQKGYLYAKTSDVELQFAGTMQPIDVEMSVGLSYKGSGNLQGWNLVGNPFAFNAYTDRSYYVASYNPNAENKTILGEYPASQNEPIPPCTGIFVKATTSDDVINFSNESYSIDNPVEGTSNNGIIQMSMAMNATNRGNASIVDRALLSFNAGDELEKFVFNENNAKLYISQNGKDYAIAVSEGQGTMPVNFRANEDGNYTITVNPEGVEMNYLHLIDNMTGNDIDLLMTPSYSFDATTNDFESRFRLVFAAANNEDGASTGSAAFAFMSDGNWIINNSGEATLQVIDLNGRILSSERVNGSVSKTINATPGVYMLRLINGENVMVQKIVVR